MKAETQFFTIDFDFFYKKIRLGLSLSKVVRGSEAMQAYGELSFACLFLVLDGSRAQGSQDVCTSHLQAQGS